MSKPCEGWEVDHSLRLPVCVERCIARVLSSQLVHCALVIYEPNKSY